MSISVAPNRAYKENMSQQQSCQLLSAVYTPNYGVLFPINRICLFVYTYYELMMMIKYFMN